MGGIEPKTVERVEHTTINISCLNSEYQGSEKAIRLCCRCEPKGT